MIRNLKILGLALVAMAAIGAMSAQGAFAAEEFLHWHPGKENPHAVVLTGEQDPAAPSQVTRLFTNAGVEKASVTCEGLKLEGTVEGVTHESPETGLTVTSQTTTLHPEYSKCKSSLGSEATVNSHKCHYHFEGKETAAGGVQPAGIECPEGEFIEISTAGCTVKVGSQAANTTEGGVHYVNNKPAGTNEWDLTAEANQKAVNFTSSALCQLVGIPAKGEKSTYEGKQTIKGFEDLGGETGKYSDKAQLGIWFGPTL